MTRRTAEPLSYLEALLLRWGTSGIWETSRLLTDHTAAVVLAKTGHHGGHLGAPGMERWWTQTTDRGIALHKRLTDLGGTPDHLLTWGIHVCVWPRLIGSIWRR